MLMNNKSFINEITTKKLSNLFNQSCPYYTSYPTLGMWSDAYTEKTYRQDLENFFRSKEDVPIALYVHIPFCAKLCYYCICSLEITNNYDRKQKFVDYMLREIDMLRNFLNERSIKLNVKEIHLGGGTPSHLENDQFTAIIEGLNSLTKIENLSEFAMEIDPRTVTQDKLVHYSKKGVSRISFGIQDFDIEVQKAINRVQPFEMVSNLLNKEVRNLFTGFNFDLLYGLPKQTEETFSKTLELVNELSPERITLLKYAHTPNLRKHMDLIKESDLISDEILPKVFCNAVEYLIDKNYNWIGLDNFAKKTDTLSLAADDKTIHRDFNGWNTGKAKHLIGIGPSTTAAFGNTYCQSVSKTKDYYEYIDRNEFPIFRGYKMSDDDVIRRKIIFELICNQEVDFNIINQEFGINFKKYFILEIENLKKEFLDKEFIELDENKILITHNGRFFSRHIAKNFDQNLKSKTYVMTGPT